MDCTQCPVERYIHKGFPESEIKRMRTEVHSKKLQKRHATARNNCLDCTHRTQGGFWSCAGTSELISWLDGRYLKSDSDIFAISLDVSCAWHLRSPEWTASMLSPSHQKDFELASWMRAALQFWKLSLSDRSCFKSGFFSPDHPKIRRFVMAVLTSDGVGAACAESFWIGMNWNWGRRWRESLGLTTFHGGYNELQHVPTLQWLYHVVSLIYIYISYYWVTTLSSAQWGSSSESWGQKEGTKRRGEELDWREQHLGIPGSFRRV